MSGKISTYGPLRRVLIIKLGMTLEASLLPARSSRGLSSVQPVARLFPSGCYLNGLQGDSRVGWDLTGVKMEKYESLPP